MKVSVLSLGCKVNQAEMSYLESAARGKGHDIVGLSEGPDLCIINTCAVTSRGDYQSRQLIRRAGRTGARVIVTGCYSELKPDEVSSMQGVERVIENDKKDSIIKTLGYNGECYTLNARGSRSRFFLKVQDGCNHSCSYCIVPRARGRPRSIRPEEAVAEINRSVALGYREAVLTGVNLGLYGRDIGSSLFELIEGCLLKTGVERIRLSSLEVTEIDDRLLSLMEEERLCNHLHIPLQSGDDDVLKFMGRPYDTLFIKETVERITSRLGDIALGTDIIAGFPQEDVKAFDKTHRFLSGLPISYMHVFPYSRRPGTAAASMTDVVGQGERKRRAAILRRLAEEKKTGYLGSQKGRTLDVLIEKRISKEEFSGTSGNYLKVHVRGRGLISGSLVPVRVEGMIGEALYGETVII
jgi:threonylcarbamoyladenosine tRNA methylthiotransferase MtaB